MVWLRLLLIIMPILIHIPKGRLECTNFYKWEKTNKLLFCPNSCDKNIFPIDKDRCCSCKAVPEWSCNSNYTSRKPYLEYIDIKGKSKMVNQNQEPYDVFKISHVGGFMSDVPVNVCDFPRTVEIDFSYNKMRSLGDISCLVTLDTIILSHNLIRVVRKHTFLNLRHVRKVDLSHNRITVFELGTISSAGSGIHYMNLHNNYLSSIDVIDIVLETSFCMTDLSKNKISEITNDNAWVVNTNITYGSGGRVDLRRNQFTKLLDFENLGFQDLRLLGKLLGFTFDIRDAKFPCDCKMQPFLALSEDILAHVYRDFFKIRCASPEHMKGGLIVEFVRNKSLDMFVCEFKRTCPSSCVCFEQPSQNRTVINCSSRNLSKMPSRLPRHHNLDIDFSGNNIREIVNVHYLSNISKIDLSYNDISNIPRYLVSRSRFAVNISLLGNKGIKQLPRIIQSMDPCVFQFGALNLDCSCNTIWVKEWLIVKGSGKCNMFIVCDIGQKQKINIKELSEDILVCTSGIHNFKVVIISMIIASIIIGVTAIITKMYEVEIYLLWRSLRQTDQCKNPQEIRFDAFISLDEEDLELLSWVTHQFLPSLEFRGYRFFLPCRDLDPGSVREEAVRDSLSKSKNYIVFLSNNYFNLEQPWTSVEWRMTWNLYTRFMDKRIITINYGQVRTITFGDSVLKAFIRLRLYIDFSNRKHELMSEIQNQLGNPIKRQRFSESAKPLFRADKIWPNGKL